MGYLFYHKLLSFDKLMNFYICLIINDDFQMCYNMKKIKCNIDKMVVGWIINLYALKNNCFFYKKKSLESNFYWFV